LCAKHQTIRNFLNTNSNQGKNKTPKEKKCDKQALDFVSHWICRRSLELSNMYPERMKPKPVILSLIEESSTSRLLPIKESPQESQLFSSIAAIVKGSPLPCQGISAC
jgi:hypothetical protein